MSTIDWLEIKSEICMIFDDNEALFEPMLPIAPQGYKKCVLVIERIVLCVESFSVELEGVIWLSECKEKVKIVIGKIVAPKRLTKFMIGELIHLGRHYKKDGVLLRLIDAQ